MKKVYTVAIVGAGSISQAHMNGYNLNKDRVEVIGVVDPYKIAQDEFKNEYSVKKSFNNIDELFDDFILTPFRHQELEARLKHLFWSQGVDSRGEVLSHGDLVLNLETYQAAVDGRPLDLTYMEYELLKFLVSHPGKVFSRETLLSRVWGYDYFGGARTVDVHVRRLRSKLGEEYASLIQTIRSVGYSFGQSRWNT